VAESVRRATSKHAAAHAWATLTGRTGKGKVEELKVTKKSSVYRLHGAGPDGSAVVAKRRRNPGATDEAEFYERVLPRLAVPRTRYYGRVDDEDGCFWLFLGDAGDRMYRPRRSEHRAMAARWLGHLHASGASDGLESLLRSRGPQYYAKHLRAGRHRVEVGMANTALSSEDRAVLETLLQQCDLIESRWQDVVRSCEGFPRTVVHGDFVGKNVRLLGSGGSEVMIALDWETAGWGSPAPDLAHLTLHDGRAVLEAYRETVRDRWPDLLLEDVLSCATVGMIFRLAASVSWASRGLAYEWVRRPMGCLRSYRNSLADAMARLGWA
jgi:Phosphotransferase enzyme family